MNFDEFKEKSQTLSVKELGKLIKLVDEQDRKAAGELFKELKVQKIEEVVQKEVKPVEECLDLVQQTIHHNELNIQYSIKTFKDKIQFDLKVNDFQKQFTFKPKTNEITLKGKELLKIQLPTGNELTIHT